MLTQNDLEEILHTALSRGGDFAEIFLEETTSTQILMEENRLEKAVQGTEMGAGLRVLQGDRTFFASATTQDLKELLRTAGNLASSVNESRKVTSQPLKPRISSLNWEIEKHPRKVTMEERTSWVRTANDIARKTSTKIVQVTVASGDTVQAVTIANTNGVYVEDNRVRTRFFTQVIAQENGILQTGYEVVAGTRGFELLEKHSPEQIAETATRRALTMLTAKVSPSGLIPVILSSEAGGTFIHEACGHGLESDHIQRGSSVYANKMGQRVASELVTVLDDATLPGSYGSFRFDDEGTPSARKVLIDQGVLRGYMSDLASARSLSIPPSGNGRRESFRNKPIPRMTNTFVDRGTTDPQLILDSIPEGLFVKKMGGGEVNPTNGNFVFEVVEGYWLVKGKIAYPVRGAMLTGNGPEVLQSIDLVGNDMGWAVGTCGKFDHAPVGDGQPTLRLPKIVVGAKGA